MTFYQISAKHVAGHMDTLKVKHLWQPYCLIVDHGCCLRNRLQNEALCIVGICPDRVRQRSYEVLSLFKRRTISISTCFFWPNTSHLVQNDINMCILQGVLVSAFKMFQTFQLCLSFCFRCESDYSPALHLSALSTLQNPRTARLGLLIQFLGICTFGHRLAPKRNFKE